MLRPKLVLLLTTFRTDIWRTSHQMLECGTRPFFRRVRAQWNWWLQKCLETCRHSLKKERLGRQAINLTPPRRIKAWEAVSPRLEELTVWHGCQAVHWKPLQKTEIFQYSPCLRNTTPFIPPRYRKSRGRSHYTIKLLSSHAFKIWENHIVQR